MSTPLVSSTPKDREDLKLGLFVDALRRGGEARLRAWGASMLPSLWPGDQLTLQNVTQDEVVPGDIVLVIRGKRCFIHRVVAQQTGESGSSLITRGDAMPGNDPPSAAAEFLGRVVSVRRGNRNFVPAPRVSFVHAATAWLLSRSDRLRNLALRIHAASARSEKYARSDAGAWEGVIPGISVSHPS